MEKNVKRGRSGGGGWYSGDEELGAVGVGSGICHGKKARLGVFLLEIFVCEFIAVDGLSSSTAKHTQLAHGRRMKGESSTCDG